MILFPTAFGSALFRRALTEAASHLRVSDGAYAQVEDDLIACSVIAPGLDPQKLTRIIKPGVPYPLGTVAVGLDVDVRAKDRFLVNGRTYDVLSPHSPDSKEFLHYSIIREVGMPERELWLALKPAGYDGAAVDEVEPELLRVLPIPYIQDAPIETVNEHGQIAILDSFKATEIPRTFFSDANLRRLLYCLVVTSDVTPTPENVAKTGDAKMFNRYRFKGAPEFEDYRWNSDFPWCVRLVEVGR